MDRRQRHHPSWSHHRRQRNHRCWVCRNQGYPIKRSCGRQSLPRHQRIDKIILYIMIDFNNNSVFKLRFYLQDSAWQNCRALIVNSESELRCCKDFEKMSPKEQKNIFVDKRGTKLKPQKRQIIDILIVIVTTYLLHR